jgi:hypothetical protein
VPTAAETRGVGNLHAGAFANPYAPVTLPPVAAAAHGWPRGRAPACERDAAATRCPPHRELQATSAGVSAWVEWWTPTGAASGCRRCRRLAGRAAGARRPFVRLEDATSRSRAATPPPSPPGNGRERADVRRRGGVPAAGHDARRTRRSSRR